METHRSTSLSYLCSEETNYSVASPTNEILSLANETNMESLNFTAIESFDNDNVNSVIRI